MVYTQQCERNIVPNIPESTSPEEMLSQNLLIVFPGFITDTDVDMHLSSSSSMT